MRQTVAPLALFLTLSASVLLASPGFSQQAPPTPEDSPAPATNSEPATPPQPAPRPTINTETSDELTVINNVQYECDGGKGFYAEYLSNNTVAATFGSKELVLPQVVAASGIRYSNGSVTLWSKGDTAFVEVGNKVLFKNCVSIESVEGRW